MVSDNNISATPREALVASCCHSHWTASTPTPLPNGDGSSCFPPPGFVLIRDGDHRQGFTSMSRSSRKPPPTRRAKLASPSEQLHIRSGILSQHIYSGRLRHSDGAGAARSRRRQHDDGVY